MRKLLFPLLAASLTNLAPAWAAEGDWDRARSAHERGDYAAELAIVQPMAEKGYPFAQFNLGVLYDEGKGVPEDNAKAMEWYRRAADQGFPQAQVNLGIMHQHGEGTPASPVAAYFWFALAEKQGDGQAGQAKQDIAKKMTPAQIQDAERQVQNYLATHKFTVPPAPPVQDSGTKHGNG